MTKTIETILVPTDFSAAAAAAVDYAAMMAQRFGAAIHLVHVCEVPSMATMDAYAVTYEDWNQRLQEATATELDKAAAGVKDVPVTTEVLFGNPPKAIVAAAQARRADLIIMGTHGHGAVLHLVLGNVAERVVRTAKCPVLTVREPDASRTPAA